MADANSTEANAEAAPKAGGGILGMAVPPLIAGAAAFAGAWFLPIGGGSASQASSVEGGEQGEYQTAGADTDDHGKKSKKGKKGDSKVDMQILKLEPIVVSLAQENSNGKRAPRIRVVVAVEGPSDSFNDSESLVPKLRDSFTGVVRSLPVEMLVGPSGLELLRASFINEAMLVLGEDGVSSILITDFIIT